MLLITDIQSQKKRGRFSLFLDGVFAFGISETTLAKSGLYVGKEISRETFGDIVRLEISSKLKQRVLNKLIRRPHSVYELKAYLKNIIRKNRDNWKSGIGSLNTEIDFDSIVDEVIADLERLDLVSDEKFAQWWVENRIANKPRSSFFIKSELKQKGIDDEIIRCLEINSEDDFEMANVLFEKKFRTGNVDRDKVIRFLRNKGFNWDIIEKVLKENSL